MLAQSQCWNGTLACAADRGLLVDTKIRACFRRGQQGLEVVGSGGSCCAGIRHVGEYRSGVVRPEYVLKFPNILD
jgi:hypothetical protein